MDQNIQLFLHSGLLDLYIIGQTSKEETILVESYISKYAEIKILYSKKQHHLELISKLNEVEAPASLLNSILTTINTDTAKNNTHAKPIALHSNTTKTNTTPWYKIGIAATVATLLFASASYFLYHQNKLLSKENQVVVEEIFDLRSDINQNNKKLDDLMHQFLKLNNPETEKYVFKAKKRAKNLKTVAYINPIEKTSLIDVVSLPDLPEEEQFQIWADIEGKMVSLGILEESDRKLKQIPYAEDALGLHITIEKKGKNTKPYNKGNSVAEISLKNN